MIQKNKLDIKRLWCFKKHKLHYEEMSTNQFTYNEQIVYWQSGRSLMRSLWDREKLKLI